MATREEALAGTPRAATVPQRTAQEPLRRHRGVTVRVPRRRLSLRLLEFWAHRHLTLFFGWEYAGKYARGTWLGWIWIPLNPVIAMLSRALVFGGLLSVGSGDRPYLIFLIVGTAAWLVFYQTAFWGFRSLQYQRRIFQRASVPWLPAIFGAVIPGTVEAFLYGTFAAIVGLYYKLTEGSFYIVITPATAATILGAVLLVLCGWTVGLWMGPLVLRARDLRYILRYLFSFWYFLTPVIFSTSSIPEKYRPLAVYNPLTAPVELVKYGVLQTAFPSSKSLVATVLALVVLFPLGLVFCAFMERLAHARV